MTLREWFAESETHHQAVNYGRNGKMYIYHRDTRSKLLDELIVDQEVDLSGELEGKQGAWLYRR